LRRVPIADEARLEKFFLHIARDEHNRLVSNRLTGTLKR
jgi:hypothetical protein